MRGFESCFNKTDAKTGVLYGTLVLFVSLILLISATRISAAQFNGDPGYNNYFSTKYKKKRKVYKKRRTRKYRKVSRAAKKKTPVFNVAKNDKEPVQIIVSLPKQQAKIYKGDKVVATTRVSTGKAGHRTPAGIYSIIQKNRRHYSNLYAGAPMPYMQRITWSGIALHAGVVPGYPASHGCIRLPHSFASQLFKFTKKGVHVVITKDDIDKAGPKRINHASLFQPALPVMDDEETAALSNDPSVKSMTASASIATAAYASSIDTGSMKKADWFSADGIPSHIERLKGRERIKAVQRMLNFLKYDAGRVDGAAGRATRAAIRRFQYDFLMTQTGKITDELFNRLFKHVNREEVTLGRDPKNPKHAEALNKPVRILITRRTEKEKVKDVQRILRFLKYYEGYADGQVGRKTRKAISKFQYDFMMKQTGTITDDLVDRLYLHANWGDVPTGHIYVRQDFKDIFDMPMVIRNGSQPLGTHLFSTLHFEKGDREITWLGQTLQSNGTKAKKRWDRRKRKYVIVKPATPPTNITAKEALDRVVIPGEARKRVENMLTPGSSLVIADGGWGSETGIGTDFIVLAR